MIVVDLGAGTGFYSIPIAQMTPKGKVYAVEIQRDYLTTIKNKAKEMNLDNLDCLLGDVERIGGTKLREEIADVVIASNILFQIENRERFIEEMRRILKIKGRVLLIDWLNNSVISSSFKKPISKDKAREMFENGGFVFDREIDTNPHHYGMIFRKK